ncbi:MAG: Flp pilus assembly complex ATPase component TadA [Candidatus Hydrogenedentes bacterium]|nr:Flp pilus assembly complex ATPase component TadA [Candidatus Hydrogenedentota bacterium]
MQEPKAFEQLLLRQGIVDESKLERARSEAAKNNLSLVSVIPQLGFSRAEAVYAALADFCEMRFIVPSREGLDKGLAEKAPARFATHYGFVPVQERNGILVVAVSDPLNPQLIDDIRMVLKCRIEAVVTTPQEIVRATKELYGVGADTMERILIDAEEDGPVLTIQGVGVGADLGDDTIDASIIKFVNELILEAVQSDTTDIHIEPFEDSLRVRYRIDGILHQAPTPPSIQGFHAAIVSRIKIMANLNIAEKRLPQDGKIQASFGEDYYDLRVSILPTAHGETVNIRILSRSSMSMTLEQMGFSPEDLKLFNSLITKPYGIILVTGPTGSGKTTTLYAALAKLNSIDRKIITIEDPIEYQLQGISQMQVQPKIGFDFSLGLRSMLRHDPDIMLVGEIRDHETAEMAIRSSLTGHLVLSTLHTNDSAGAVTRLIDMGIEPFLISSTMVASVAQRLVRRICPHCAKPVEPDPALLRAEFGVSDSEIAGGQYRKGEGCEECLHTGYHGRIAIYEILPFTDRIKEMTVNRANAAEIKKEALLQGLRTLRASGWQRIHAGETTPEEVLRVTADSDAPGVEST